MTVRESRQIAYKKCNDIAMDIKELKMFFDENAVLFPVPDISKNRFTDFELLHMAQRFWEMGEVFNRSTSPPSADCSEPQDIDYSGEDH